MTEYASVDELLIGPVSLPEADLELSGGQVIRLRGLSRYALFANGKGTEDSGTIEIRNLVSCAVQPALTKDQAEALMRRVGAGDGHKISMMIRELSGLGEGADKSAVVEVRD